MSGLTLPEWKRSGKLLLGAIFVLSSIPNSSGKNPNRALLREGRNTIWPRRRRGGGRDRGKGKGPRAPELRKRDDG